MRRLMFAIILIMLSAKVAAYDTQVNNPITVENVHQLTKVNEWQGASSVISNLVFNPINASLVFIEHDHSIGYGSIQFLNAVTVEPIAESKLTDDVLSFTFSPDGTLFANIDSKGNLNIYETQDFKLISSMQVGLEPILNLAIDIDNQYVGIAIGAPEIVTTEKFVFQLFAIETGIELLSLKRQSADLDEVFGTGILFDDAGENVFLSTSDGKIYKWNINSQRAEIVTDGALRSTQILEHSQKFQLIYLQQNGGVGLLDNNGELHTVTSKQHTEARYFFASSIAAHPTEPLVAISYIMPNSRTDAPALQDSILQIWDIDSGTLLVEILVSDPGPNRLTELAFSPNGTLLASGGADGTVRLWGVAE